MKCNVRIFETLEPRNFDNLKPRSQEAKKPRNQETTKPRDQKPSNQETKKPKYQETKKPRTPLPRTGCDKTKICGRNHTQLLAPPRSQVVVMKSVVHSMASHCFLLRRRTCERESPCLIHMAVSLSFVAVILAQAGLFLPGRGPSPTSRRRGFLSRQRPKIRETYVCEIVFRYLGYV